MGIPLLQIRLYIPPPCSELVPHLLERLNEGLPQADPRLCPSRVLGKNPIRRLEIS